MYLIRLYLVTESKSTENQDDSHVTIELSEGDMDLLPELDGKAQSGNILPPNIDAERSLSKAKGKLEKLPHEITTPGEGALKQCDTDETIETILQDTEFASAMLQASTPTDSGFGTSEGHSFLMDLGN